MRDALRGFIQANPVLLGAAVGALAVGAIVWVVVSVRRRRREG